MDASGEGVRDVEGMPTFAAVLGGEVIGFLSVRVHNEYSAEIYVMAVLREHHRSGVGRALVFRALSWLRERRFEFLQVKTLAASAQSEPYDRTRRFYLGLGFRPIEELPALWRPENPCLLMIKAIGDQAE